MNLTSTYWYLTMIGIWERSEKGGEPCIYIQQYTRIMAIYGINIRFRGTHVETNPYVASLMFELEQLHWTWSCTNAREARNLSMDKPIPTAITQHKSFGKPLIKWNKIYVFTYMTYTFPFELICLHDHKKQPRWHYLQVSAPRIPPEIWRPEPIESYRVSQNIQ